MPGKDISCPLMIFYIWFPMFLYAALHWRDRFNWLKCTVLQLHLKIHKVPRSASRWWLLNTLCVFCFCISMAAAIGSIANIVSSIKVPNSRLHLSKQSPAAVKYSASWCAVAISYLKRLIAVYLKVQSLWEIASFSKLSFNVFHLRRWSLCSIESGNNAAPLLWSRCM